VLDNVDAVTAQVLTSLDGRRSEAEVLAAATEAGADAHSIAATIASLRSHGYVVDGEEADISALGSPDAAERLEPDHAALGLARPTCGPVETLRRRRERLVVLHGGGRLGAPVGALLAAAGVGRLAIVDRAESRPCDSSPAGIAARDVFAPRDAAVARAVRRAAPEADVGPLRPDHRPDLAVLAGMEPVDMSLREGLYRLGVPHLAVVIRESTAVIGPLVLPARSTCLTCIDISRTDRDAEWPAVLTQLAMPIRRQREPADVVLATMAASITAMQALELLDGGRPSAVGGTLEIRPPDPRIRRRTWPPHPGCDCGAAANADPQRIAG
jgi:bacteriocin biosynthesis cyclodehydratase domain-containing protein